MTTQHTPGRLLLDDAQPGDIRRYLLAESNAYPHVVASVPLDLQPKTAEANARRLVACWNACEGISTHALEVVVGMGASVGDKIAALEASERELMGQRDELLDALKDLCEDIEEAGATPLDRPAYYKARAAIAKPDRQADGREDDEMSDVTILPDGSAFSVMSFPLPKDHWLYAPNQYRDGEWEPVDLPKPILTHAQRDTVIAAIRYAVRGATMRGMEMDFDPDALVQNAVYALCGPYSRTVEAIG